MYCEGSTIKLTIIDSCPYLTLNNLKLKTNKQMQIKPQRTEVDMKPGERSELAESEQSKRCQLSELDISRKRYKRVGSSGSVGV